MQKKDFCIFWNLLHTHKKSYTRTGESRKLLSEQYDQIGHIVTGVVLVWKGASINYLGRRGGGGLAKCLCYYISLCSKLVYGGGRGVKNLQNPVYVVYERPLILYGAEKLFASGNTLRLNLVTLEVTQVWTHYSDVSIYSLHTKKFPQRKKCDWNSSHFSLRLEKFWSAQSGTFNRHKVCR